MGEVIQFRRAGAGPHAVSRRSGKLSSGMAASAAAFDVVQARLRSAEAHGERALAKLGECHDLLDWTANFCGECLAATEAPDLGEMVRRRDELLQRFSRRQSDERSRCGASDR